jgi:group I intron endonuclease
MPCGIYAIKNKLNGQVYIGKSTNIEKRFIRHRSLLKCNHHYNSHLQRSYNKYGKKEFEFVALEQCGPDDLPAREQYWIDAAGVTCYNHILYVEDQVGKHNSFYGKHHSRETKKKMSDKKQGRYEGANNPNYGKKQSSATRLKMSENRGKLIKGQVLEIVLMLKEGVLSHEEISRKYKIARTVVTRISNGTRWANVTGGPIMNKKEAKCQD